MPFQRAVGTAMRSSSRQSTLNSAYRPTGCTAGSRPRTQLFAPPSTRSSSVQTARPAEDLSDAAECSRRAARRAELPSELSESSTDLLLRAGGAWDTRPVFRRGVMWTVQKQRPSGGGGATPAASFHTATAAVAHQESRLPIRTITTSATAGSSVAEDEHRGGGGPIFATTGGAIAGSGTVAWPLQAEWPLPVGLPGYPGRGDGRWAAAFGQVGAALETTWDHTTPPRGFFGHVGAALETTWDHTSPLLGSATQIQPTALPAELPVYPAAAAAVYPVGPLPWAAAFVEAEPAALERVAASSERWQQPNWTKLQMDLNGLW